MMTAVSTLPDAPAVPSSYCWTFPLTGPAVPAVSASRRAGVRFAGTLFDRTALASELGAAATENPADLVARACERWGAGAIEHLRGAFAVAIDDQRRGELIVARDHAGLCPVFYATHGGSISFAASPQALVALPGVSRELNRVALATRLPPVPDVEETFFAAVRRLPSGCMIVVAAAVADRYGIRLPKADAGSIHDHIQEQFEEWQTRAVRRCVDLDRVRSS
jgi:asparagine synthetase B (glutamine-hydrolysing)